MENDNDKLLKSVDNLKDIVQYEERDDFISYVKTVIDNESVRNGIEEEKNPEEEQKELEEDARKYRTIQSAIQKMNQKRQKRIQDEGNENNEVIQEELLRLEPVDNSQFTPRMLEKMREIRLHELTIKDKKRNLNRLYIDVQLIRIISPTKELRAYVYDQQKNKKSNNGVEFKRLFLCRVNSHNHVEDNGKVLYLMEKTDLNFYFQSNVEHRDTGIISVGGYFRIRQPFEITRFLKGRIPLLRTSMPLVAMKPPLELYNIRIEKLEEEITKAFVLKNLQLNVTRTTPIKSFCTGSFCDKQRISEIKAKDNCGCYTFKDKYTSVVLEHTINTSYQNTEIEMEQFSSTKFDKCFLTDVIPFDISFIKFRDGDLLWDVEESIQDILDFVNNNNGWTIIGWYKRGLTKDENLIGDYTVSKKDRMIASSNLKLNIVQITPSKKEFYIPGENLYTELQTKKFDVNQLPLL